MEHANKLKQFVLGLAIGFCSTTLPAVAQSVTPTSGVGEASTQVSGTSALTITGGRQQLNTLFHSFEDFSPEAANVLFQLDGSQNAVEYVISRVTGDSLSLIDGQLKLSGGNNPDLFLINPNGITFGSRASLALPGSFIASTAESVLFNNDVDFSAVAPASAPLLTVSTPTGLQFGSAASSLYNQSAIEVINNGHSLVDNGFLPFTGGSTDIGLRLSTQETIALIGHNVNLLGGIVSNTAGGQMHLGSVRSGRVDLVSSGTNWSFDYSPVSIRSDITLTDRAIVNASGLQVGLIDISAQDLTVEGGSMILTRNYGPQAASDIRVDALGDVNINGLDSNAQLPSRIISGAFNSGRGSNIDVQADNVLAQKGGSIVSISYGSGTGGHVDVQAEELVQLVGLAPTNPTLFSTISSSAVNSGDAGNLDIDSKRLTITDGNSIASAVLFTGTGNGGTVQVTASDSIDIQGFNSTTGSNSAITSSTFGRGNSGDLTVDTGRLTLRGAGLIGSLTSTAGNAGNVVIDADQEIIIAGQNSNEKGKFATIGSEAGIASDAFQLLFGLPAFPTGNAGNTEITTPVLSITDGAELSVRNEGTGEGGLLTVNADRIYLNADGNISAQTNVGNGGSISLSVDEVLLMRRSSLIDTESQAIGNGGNISITAPIIIGLENSDIVADAVRGNGGNIDITTQSILGLEFREQRTSKNDITASSEFGVSGTVEINNLTVDSTLGLVELPSVLADVDDQIAIGCASSRGNQFIASGRGGVPVSPATLLSSNRPWIDLRGLSDDSEREPNATAVNASKSAVEAASVPELVEASGWQISQDGSVELLTAAIALNNLAPPACLVKTHAG